MRRLSSSLVLRRYKGPGLRLLGTAAVSALLVVLFLAWRGQLAPAWLPAPLLLTAVGAGYIGKFVFPLADEVFDDGEALVVRRSGRSTRIPLREVNGVGYFLVLDPPRVVLPTRGAGEIAFMPYLTPGTCLFQEYPLVAELGKRCAGSSS